MVDIPNNEPRQIVCTGEAGSNQWNPAFGTWEFDYFGMDSDEHVGDGERLFVNRRLYDDLAQQVERLRGYLSQIETATSTAEGLSPDDTITLNALANLALNGPHNKEHK